jgi:hypothetical protein
MMTRVDNKLIRETTGKLKIKKAQQFGDISIIHHF